MSQKQARRNRQELRAQGVITHRRAGEPTPYFSRQNRPAKTRRTIWYERALELQHLAQEMAEKVTPKRRRKTRSEKLAEELESE